MGARTNDMVIRDNTDGWWIDGKGECLEKRISSICNALTRRIENLARSVAYGASARTEQGIPFEAYANGVVKPEGSIIRPKLVAGDMGADAQVKAFQDCAEETFEAILANKPVGADLLIWREEPSSGRALYPEGLHVHIYTRLAWDRLRNEAANG